MNSELALAGGLIYLAIFIILAGGGLWANAVAEDRQESRVTARFTLMTPLWPVLALMFIGRKLAELIRDAASEKQGGDQ